MHTCRLAPTIGLAFGTHLPTNADWLLRRFKFQIGGIAPISPDDWVGVWYAHLPTNADSQSAVGDTADCQSVGLH